MADEEEFHVVSLLRGYVCPLVKERCVAKRSSRHHRETSGFAVFSQLRAEDCPFDSACDEKYFAI